MDEIELPAADACSIVSVVMRRSLVTIHAIAVRRHEPGFLDLLIDDPLQRFVKLGTILCDVVQVLQLGLD